MNNLTRKEEPVLDKFDIRTPENIKKIATRMVEILAAENMTVKDGKRALYTAIRLVDYGVVHPILSISKERWTGTVDEKKLCGELEKIRERADALSIFLCSHCHEISASDQGECPSCGKKFSLTIAPSSGSINEEILRNEIRKQRDHRPLSQCGKCYAVYAATEENCPNCGG